MSNARSCPFCGLVDDHTDNCYFTLKLEGATIGVIQAAWNRRAPVSTPQQSAQRASVDTLSAIADSIECDGLVRTAAKLREEIAHINAWGSAGSGATGDALEAAARICEGRAEHWQQIDGTYAAGKKDGAFECAENIRFAKQSAAPSPAPQGEQA